MRRELTGVNPSGVSGLALVAASVLLSSAIQATSKTLLETIDSLYLLFMGQVVAGVFMAVLYGLLSSLPDLRRLGTRALLAFLAVTVLGGLIGPLLLFEGLKLTSATNAVLVGRSESVITFIAGAWLLRESVTRYQWVGGVLILAGSVLTVVVESSSVLTLPGAGDVLVLGSAAAWSLGTVIYRAVLRDAPTRVIVLYRNLVGATLCLIFGVLFFGKGHLPLVFSANRLPLVIAYAVGIMTLSQLFWYKGLALVSITRASVFTLAAPVTGVVFASLLLGESISLGHILGGVFILVGMAIGLLRYPVQHGNRSLMELRWLK